MLMQYNSMFQTDCCHKCGKNFEQKDTTMKQIEKVKQLISKAESSIELAGYLDGIKAAAAIYCREHAPDELIEENGKVLDVTICGMCYYLESEVGEK